MQILEIVLYGRNGKKRVLGLKPGAVNIITGRSHTGKSALIYIVSFCLGGKSCHVPAGRILDATAWFGLLLKIGDEQVFVARQNPYPQQGSNTLAYLLRGVEGSPARPPAGPNMNLDAFEDALTRLLGIAPNRHTPPSGSTRPPLSANIRHSLLYCLQHQTEIANNQVLFHRQTADFLTQAIKDTLPYFLGAIREDELALEEQLNLARRRLKLLEIRQRENQQIQGEGASRARSLVEEILAVGILPQQPVPESLPELRTIMREALRWTPSQNVFSGSDQLSILQQEYSVMHAQRVNAAEQLRAARTLSGEAQGYRDEAQIQAERLESIHLFEDAGEAHAACPLCAQHLSVPVPGASAIQGTLAQLSRTLSTVERERPRLREHIEEVGRDLAAINERLNDKQEAINALLNEQEMAQQLRDANARRSRVVGRLSLYLETVQEQTGDDQLARDLEEARRQVQRLAQSLDPTNKEQRLNSILNRLGRRMSEQTQDLDLEFRDYQVRLDLAGATVMVDTPTEPVPLIRLGSGENWIGYHLVTHLSLHEHFRHQKRPVPGFLILDQPTQVYFPPDKDPEFEGDTSGLPDEDRQKVIAMFKLIFQVVKGLAPDFQVIVTDHADLRDAPWFQKAIVEKWRESGMALIPEDW